MHQVFYQFNFELPNQPETEKLIALLSEQGFDGFVEEEEGLTAFIPELKFKEDEFEKVLEKFSILSYTKSEIENINWNKKWEDEYEPVIVGKFAGIRAHFHQPLKNVAHEIIITPKMSFGTGHHATTSMMIRLMEQVDFKDKTVFDFGTGTGVLAILAEKLGAASILAVDNDEWSITNSLENCQKNGCTKVAVKLADSVEKKEQYDIILANITLNIITANLKAIAAASKPGGRLLLSGFLKSDETAITKAVNAAGFTKKEVLNSKDWIAVLCEK